MKNIRSITTLLGLAVICGSAMAQAPTNKQQRTKLTAEERAEKRTAHMTEKLELSEEQAEQVKEINIRYGREVEKLRNENKAERDRMRAKRDEIRAAHEQEINGVLTKEQATKWASQQEARKARKADAERNRRAMMKEKQKDVEQRESK